MLIDWFTVGAQLLNFLILVWLLKRFLYKPVLDAIDAREKHIAGELAKAAAKLTDAQKEHDEFDAKNKAFNDERAALAVKAAKESAAERESLLKQAHQDADELRATSASALAADRTLLGRQVERLAQREVFAIARKALGDLADANLEKRMTEVFTRRLRSMDAGAKALLAAALHDSTDPALLCSSFELPAADQATIQNALNEAFSAEVRIRFVTVPDTVCGIELTANGQKLAWNIGDYLKSLEQKLDALLHAESAPAPDKPPVAAPTLDKPVAAVPAPDKPPVVAPALDKPVAAVPAPDKPVVATAPAPDKPVAAAPAAAATVAPVAPVAPVVPVTPVVPVAPVALAS